MQHDLGVLFKYRYKYFRIKLRITQRARTESAINCGIYCQNRDNYKMDEIMHFRSRFVDMEFSYERKSMEQKST